MKTIWEQILDILAKNIEPGLFKVWFSSLQASVSETECKIFAPTTFVANRLQDSFLSLITSAVETTLKSSPTISISVQEQSIIASKGHFQLNTPFIHEIKQHTAIEQTHEAQHIAPASVIAGLSSRSQHAVATTASYSTEYPSAGHQLPLPIQNSARPNKPAWNYTFDSFVIGAGNELAHAATQELCASTDTMESLFLFSAPGLGKTHLLHAVGHKLCEQSNRTNPRVEYLSAEEFATNLVSAIRSKDVSRFKARYREVDVLLLEDIHFLQNKEKMQDELIATINALKTRGSRIIFSSSFAPKELVNIDKQLYSRLCSGMVAPISCPDFATRCRIFQEKARTLHQVPLSLEVTELLAKHIRADIRQIESCLKALVLKARLLNQRITIDLALEALSAYAEDEVLMDFDSIVSCVCNAFKLSPDQLKSKKRTKDLVMARNTIFYLARKHTDVSLEKLGKNFNRTHSTVIKGISCIEQEMNQKGPVSSQTTHIISDIEQNGRSSFFQTSF